MFSCSMGKVFCIEERLELALQMLDTSGHVLDPGQWRSDSADGVPSLKSFLFIIWTLLFVVVGVLRESECLNTVNVKANLCVPHLKLRFCLFI